jgi:hypothetical protein
MTDIIKVTYSSLDGARKVQRFKTVIGASEWAQHWIGKHPSLGSTYAASDDGGKIEVTGAGLGDLFPQR